MTGGSIHEIVSGRELVALLYRLARNEATGTLELARPMTRPRALLLRNGHLVASPRSPGGFGGSDAQQPRQSTGRPIGEALRRLAAEPKIRVRFEGGPCAYPPKYRRLALDGWAFAYFEASLSGRRASELARELAGVRLQIREELAPDPVRLDDTGRRLLAALTDPRRADELSGAARAPRFRTLAFLFALDQLGALERKGIGVRPTAEARTVASRALGVAASADRTAIKRAYRKLARALHPDLQNPTGLPEKRDREQKLAAVNRAYRVLLHG